MDSEEPVGLNLSLDDLIKKQADSYGKSQRRRSGARGEGGHGGRQQGGRGQGYGGPGRGAGGSFRAPQPQFQQQFQQPQFMPQPQQQQQQQQQPFFVVTPGYAQQAALLAQQQQQQVPALAGGAYQPMMVQQQPQQVRRGPAPQRRRHQGSVYRAQQSCWAEEESGDVVVQFKNSEIVRITPAGDITLRCDGFYGPTMLASLNDVLNLIGIRVTCPSGNVKEGDWSISDGRTLTRFTDGVVVPAKGPQHAARGKALLDAFNSPNRDAAAAATAASNAAAMQAGIIPHTGFVPPGRPGTGRGPPAKDTSGGVFSRLGGRGGGAEGRYAPY